MREVDKVNNGSVNQPLQPVKAEASKDNLKENSPISEDSKNEIKDLGNTPSEALGRSQVAKDNIENDIKIMQDNPEIVEKANRFFDMAEKVLQKSGTPDAPEKATLLTEAYRKEFLTK